MTNKPRLAIISTFDITCGIAYNAKVLLSHFKKFYEVDVLKVDSHLLRKFLPFKLHKLGNNSIKQISAQLKNYDYINIQLEPGIFGFFYFHSLPRVISILKAINKKQKVIINLHSIPKSQAKYKSGLITNFIKFVYNNLTKLHIVIFLLYLNYVTRSKNINIIVYNQFDYNVLNTIYKLKNIYLYPLCYFDQAQREFYQTNKENFINQFCVKKTDDIVIGLFGFIQYYKGFHDAIKALTFLPANYKIIIFGANNINSAQDILFNKLSLDYIGSLMDYINTNNLTERVIFAGSIDDQEMPIAMASVDCAVLSYYDTGQAASGPASLAFELANKIILSDIPLFRNYQNFHQASNVKFYKTDNYLELTSSIVSFFEHSENGLELNDNRTNHSNYNAENQVALYNQIFLS